MNTAPAPSVSVIIPAYNSAATLGKSIEAALAQDYPAERLEIIIVDDGSSDNTPDIIQAYPTVQFISQENGGPAKARNTGWKAARGEIILFTDADCVAAPNWVRRLVGRFTPDSVGGVGGTYDIHNKQSLFAWCVHEEIVQRHAAMGDRVNYLGSFNLAYRRKVLVEAGGFDETFRAASGEDNDLSYRVHKLGYDLLFTRHARVAHVHPEKLYPYLRSQYRHGYWRMKLYQIHPDMMSGDAYGGILDMIQPPLSLLSLALLPLCWLHPLLAVLEATLLLVGLALQAPLALKIVKRTGRKALLLLAGIAFFRSFARGLGLARGILKFGFPKPAPPTS